MYPAIDGLDGVAVVDEVLDVDEDELSVVELELTDEEGVCEDTVDELAVWEDEIEAVDEDVACEETADEIVPELDIDEDDTLDEDTGVELTDKEEEVAKLLLVVTCVKLEETELVDSLADDTTEPLDEAEEVDTLLELGVDDAVTELLDGREPEVDDPEVDEEAEEKLEDVVEVIAVAVGVLV